MPSPEWNQIPEPPRYNAEKTAIQMATWRLMNAVLSGDYTEEMIAEEELKNLEK